MPYIRGLTVTFEEFGENLPYYNGSTLYRGCSLPMGMVKKEQTHRLELVQHR